MDKVNEIKIINGQKIYKLTHTHGLPLSMALFEINKSGLEVNWQQYFDEAIKDNMNMKREFARVKEAILEAFDSNYFEMWQKNIFGYV